MIESLIILLVIAAAVVGISLIKDEKREKLIRELTDAAKGEYLNWSRAERFFTAQNPHQREGGFLSWSANKNSDKYRDVVDEINKDFVEKRLVESKNLFDQLELSNAQRLAVVRDEDANLINAGAGSGKTRTILAKVKYLIEQGLADPVEILVVVFNQKVRKEIEKKSKGIDPNITVSTFHSLGLGILRHVEKTGARVSSMVDDDRKLGVFFSEKMKEIFKDKKLFQSLTDLFSAHLFEEDPEKEIKTQDEYLKKISSVGLRSLNGQKLKSHQEVQIANWLTLSGIAWEYEKLYKHNQGKRPYQPDFYLPEYDLWLEHFGTNEDGSTAPWIDKYEYNKQIRWKQEVHRGNKTTLVETYSYESKRKGGLPGALEEKLARYGVEKRPLSDDEVDRIVENSFAPVSNFVKLIQQFLALARENMLSAEGLRERATSVRDQVFLTLFGFFRMSYEKKIKEENAIDFTDMIVRGVTYVKNESYQSKFKYILVDEYQDITKVRLDFLLALRNQVKDAKLFCVGDDWQSIYQFQGANVSLITHFEDHVDAMQRTDLDKTFRYSQKINDFSQVFITKNPNQLKKSVDSSMASEDNERPITIIYHESHGQSDELKNIVDLIAQKSQGEKQTCFVLGRYNHDKPKNWTEIAGHAKHEGIVMEFSSIHRSKGMESDWVIVVENKSDMDGYGFPSGIQSDSVLEMVQPQAEFFHHAEERRLFYVAITRTRKGVFLLVPKGMASEFIQEIDPRKNAEHFPFVVVKDNPESTILLCPKCKGETIRKKSGPYGEFYSCSRYPLCDGTLPRCDNKDCGAAIELKEFQLDDVYQCVCGREHTICPSCECGVLQQRNGINGKFLGCSQYSVTECKHTESI